jgi:hypothetical protein
VLDHYPVKAIPEWIAGMFYLHSLMDFEVRSRLNLSLAVRNGRLVLVAAKLESRPTGVEVSETTAIHNNSSQRSSSARWLEERFLIRRGPVNGRRQNAE